MAGLQLRTVMPSGVGGAAYARRISEMMEDAATMLLSGAITPEKYPAAVARYQVLKELVDFAEDYAKQPAEGKTADDV